MSEEAKKEGSGAAGVAGFQIPMGIRKRKAKVDELLRQCEDINEGDVLAYWHGMDDKMIDPDCKDLDEGNFEAVAGRIRDHVVREIVRKKVREVVRKKPGGGGYVLYAPNKGKKGKAKSVGSFPTKLGAKRAELARFPPKDPGKAARLRKEVDRLMKSGEKKDKEQPKKESVTVTTEVVKDSIREAIMESLFREEQAGSDWDETIGRLSKQALQGDSKFQGLMKGIEKKTQKALEDSFSIISKSIDKKKVKLKNFGVKKADSGKTYLAFSASMDGVEVAPLFIYIEGSTPRIEVSDQAKAALTKAEPDTAKLFRAELVTVQERVLDKMDALEKAVAGRDKYLAGLEGEVDDFVSNLTPLQVSLLKKLLVQKYRKV